MEYCRYILTQSNNGIVNGFFDLDDKGKIKNFMELLDCSIELYKSSFGIKEKDFSYDEMLIRTMEFFFHTDIVFLKNKGDEVVYNLYKKTKEQLKIEKKKLKNKNPISFDTMFGIITNFCILCSNTIQNENYNENEKIIIQFKTINIDPIGVRDMIGDSINIHKRKEKAEKISVQPQKSLGVLTVPLMVATKVKRLPILIGSVLAGGFFSAKLIGEILYKAKAEKDYSLFLYLLCIIAVTYTRNEELKGMIDYGW